MSKTRPGYTISPFCSGLFRRYGNARRVFQGTLICIILWTVLETLFQYHRYSTIDNIQQQQQQQRKQSTSTSSTSENRPPHARERLFIASMHWNNEAILRSHWNDAVLQLAQKWGPENIFVSIYESGSWDNSKGALRDLESRLDRLGVPRNITLSATTHRDEILGPPAGEGWVDTSRGKRELRRIPYLAKLRNLTLRPLEDLMKQGVVFDKVLFLNDVVFTVEDVISLLDTNGGVYGAACSMDFSKPPLYYDTFALRDSKGNEHVMQTWPYFRSASSRNALLNMSPVPVKSCWNGIVAMPIDPFISNPPLQFRAIPDSLAKHHLEGSECCLIHADNPLSQTQGVYVNPAVRVGYNGPAYSAVHPVSAWISLQNVALALWKNRIRRWTTTQMFKKLRVRWRVAAWQGAGSGRFEPGEFCIINEMQVLVENGWAHVNWNPQDGLMSERSGLNQYDGHGTSDAQVRLCGSLLVGAKFEAEEYSALGRMLALSIPGDIERLLCGVRLVVEL